MLAPYLAAALLLSRLDSPVTDRAETLAKEALKNGNDPRAAASLLRLHALLDDVDDLNLLAEPYTALIYRHNTDPNVRMLAKQLMSEVERARGRTTKAQELVAESGFIQDFYVVGSFENEGKSGCDTDFGPESATDLKAVYTAGSREVSWRRPHAKTMTGYVDLSLAVKPDTEAVAYGLTWIQSDADTRAVLSLGVPGGARLFVNGTKVLSSDRYNLARPDQLRVQVNLRKGLNRVLVKVCQLTGPLGFYARVEKLEGQKGNFTVVLPTAVPSLEKGAAPQPQVLPSLSEILEKRVAAAPKDAGLRADYATVLSWQRAYPESERTPAAESARAALNAPDDAEVQLIAAALQDDGNDKRRYLEKAVALAPANPWAQLALGSYELNREHADLGLRTAEALLKTSPDFAPAVVLKIRALDALGEKALAFRVAEDTFARLHVLPPIAREAASASRRADRLPQAIERVRAVLGLRFDDLSSRRVLAQLLADSGRIDEAVNEYRKLLTLDPFDQSAMLRLAELLSANGRLDEARAQFDVAKQAAPEEPEVFEREGRALLHANERDAAIASFQRALVLRPQNPALKEMLRSLRGDDGTTTTPEAFALPALLAEKFTVDDAQDAVTLAEVTHVRVQTSGLSSRFQQLVVKVLNQRGVESFRALPITWSPDRQEVRVIKARITKPDGSIVDSFGDEERSMNESWSGMYYDARARVLSFPALAPGDVLEIQWRTDDTSVENLLSDYWGDVDTLQSLVARRHYRYVVDMPASRPLAWNKQTLPKWVAVQTNTTNERTMYRFEANDVPRIIPEPNMPGWAESSPVLHLSTYQNWEQVGRYYWGLVRDQLTPNDELKKVVDTALKGIDRNDTQKVVAALYDFVVTNTRYVALEFGIHGYKPYRVTQVLARRFGDCKDKASLINAMLKVAGVDSRLVLLRMRHLGTLSPEVASLAAFNHAIVYVPKLDLFLDGTAEFHGSRELPTSDRIANVLIVEPEGVSRFLTTPEAVPTDNLTSMKLNVTLKPDGSASSQGEVVARGQSAPEFRRLYETPATRTAQFEQQWSQSYPGLRASEVTVSDVKNLEQPVTLKYSATMPRFAEVGPGLLRFFPFGAGRAFTQALAPLTERTSDLVFPGVWANELEMNYTLPPNWQIQEAQREVVEASPFGEARITTAKTATGFSVKGKVVLATARISPKDYAAFRAWLMKVDQAFGHKLVAQQGGQTASR